MPKEPHGILGISTYIDSQNIYYYIAVPTDKPVPCEMVEFEIPAATWVIFECNGHFKESVQTIFKRFFTEGIVTEANKVFPNVFKAIRGNYTSFILPGIMVLVTLACCSSSGYINFIMKSKGSFYRILIAPVSRSSIVLGQMLESVCVSFIEVGIMLILSIFLSVHIASGFIGLLLMLPLIFVTAFFMSGLCYIISLSLPNEVIYETIMNLIVLCIFFASTALFPMNNISGGLKIEVMINPFTHIINCLRSLIVGTSVDLKSLLFVIVLFLFLCLGNFALALWKLKRETVN